MENSTNNLFIEIPVNLKTELKKNSSKFYEINNFTMLKENFHISLSKNQGIKEFQIRPFIKLINEKLKNFGIIVIKISSKIVILDNLDISKEFAGFIIDGDLDSVNSLR